jgi:alpha-soluble NSF attachment protein
MTDINISIAKGRNLADEAQRKVDNIEKSYFSLGSKSQKYEDAAELFTKAAKQYQLAKAYIDAGNAFLKACECYSHSSYGTYHIASCYIQAAQSFSKQDIHIGIDAMHKGINLLLEDGKFSQAAKYEKELAEMFETIGDLNNAIKHYEIASEYFDMEGSKATGASCREKIIPIIAVQGDYHKAIELIEKICDSYSSSLAKHYIKELCLKAGILYLCIPDNVGAYKSMDKWAAKYSEFKGSREHQFLSQLIAAFMKEDSDMFKRAVDEWQRISSLDKFKDRFLEKALEKLLGDEEEEKEEEENFM